MYNSTVEYNSRIRSGSNMAAFYVWKPYKSFYIPIYGRCRKSREFCDYK